MTWLEWLRKQVCRRQVVDHPHAPDRTTQAIADAEATRQELAQITVRLSQHVAALRALSAAARAHRPEG